jgi:pimeloyl-ACP methyl ester carboxylesterase
MWNHRVVTAATTFVLLHGGGMSGAFWDRLVPLLARPALALDMPGRAGKPTDPMELTVDECVRSLTADVEAAGIGDAILVAHSSGGLFTPGLAAALAPRVRHIVLDAGSVPPEGGCGLDSMKAKHRDGILAAMEAARRDGRALLTPGREPPEKVRTAYGGDPLSDQLVAFVNDPRVCVRDTMNIYFQPVSWAVVGEVPVTYIKHLRDRPSPPEFQDELIERLRAMGRDPDVVEIDSGHIPAVTQPEELARILNRIAERVTDEQVAPHHGRAS